MNADAAFLEAAEALLGGSTTSDSDAPPSGGRSGKAERRSRSQSPRPSRHRKRDRLGKDSMKKHKKEKKRATDYITRMGEILRERGEIEGLAKDGRAFPMMASSEIILDGGRRPELVLIECTDLEAERERQAGMEQMEKMASTGQLLTATIHEINNVLTCPLGYTELLLSELTETEENRETCDRINNIY